MENINESTQDINKTGDDVINKIIEYKNTNGIRLIQKYNYKFLIGIIEKEKISEL
jgi:hypothetical protein